MRRRGTDAMDPEEWRETLAAIDPTLSTSRVSRAEALARQVEREIGAQGLGPGARIGTKTDLRERFGVAVATINEAVRLMESRGLVSARPGPGGGVFVAGVEERGRHANGIPGLDWGQATLGDCVEIRGALEPLVCRQAARHATPELIAALEASVEAMAACGDDVRAQLQANWAFHRHVVSVCQNRPLRAVYLTVVDVLDAGLDDFEFDPTSAVATEVHRDLAAAIAAGEGEWLERAIITHSAESPLSA